MKYNTALPSKNAISAFQISSGLLFYLGNFLKKLAEAQYSWITKGSIYHIKHMYIQLFTPVVDWPEIRCLREVSCTMFYICRYCVFTWEAVIEVFAVVTVLCSNNVFLIHMNNHLCVKNIIETKFCLLKGHCFHLRIEKSEQQLASRNIVYHVIIYRHWAGKTS